VATLQLLPTGTMNSGSVVEDVGMATAEEAVRQRKKKNSRVSLNGSTDSTHAFSTRHIGTPR
jgi:hypothetical protein